MKIRWPFGRTAYMFTTTQKLDDQTTVTVVQKRAPTSAEMDKIRTALDRA